MILHNSRTWLLAGFVVTAMLTRGGHAADDSPTVVDRMFSYFDGDKSGAIEAGEFAALPGPVKAWLVAHGFPAESRIARAEFVKVGPDLIADLRKGLTAASRPFPKAGGTQAQSSGGNGSTLAYSSRSAGNPAPSTETVRVTDATNRLPSRYRDRDLDGDGQVDFFEWRKWNRAAGAEFAKIDTNSDGILSCAELQFAETGNWAGGTVAGSSTTSSLPVSPGSTSRIPGNSTTSTTTGSSSSAIKSSTSRDAEETKKIKGYFDYMDMNKNGKMDPDEWKISRRIKPMFERAKIDISKPMTEADFIAHYKKVSGEDGGSRRRRRR